MAKYNWDTSYLDQIKAWQKQCAETHEACRKTLSQCDEFDVENAPLPTRCIEVIPYQQDGIWHERWILRHTAGQRGRYIALSHRWREETKASITRVDNIRCRMETCGHDHGLAASNDVWQNNTRLFQDAGHIAMLLGVQHLWIDSICIVQDDPQGKDWTHEATKMADYYQYAWLTIAATTMSEEGGLIKAIATKDLPRVTRLPYRATDGRQQGHLYVQCAGETALAGDYKTHVSQSELLQRGWVFQEWMLSRRLVMMSNSGLFLICAGAPHPQSVMGDVILSKQYKWHDPDELRDIAFSKYNEDLGKTRQDIWEQWWRIVEIYSRLQLTKYEKDRLVALAGLAREFGRAIDKVDSKERKQGGSRLACLYISGMWYGDIRGLLWEHSQKGTWERVKGIPTWSWASMGSEETDLQKGTVSWHGMSVRWEFRKLTHKMKIEVNREEKAAGKKGHTPKGFDKFFEPLCSMERAIWVPVSEEDGWEPNFADQRPLNQSIAYSGDNRFTMLELRGCIAPVNIGGSFDTQESRNIAAALTDHHSTTGRDLWRRVSIKAKPDTTIGWASLEHPDFQVESNNCRPSQALAFFVSNIKEVDGGLGFGNLMNKQVAYNVLFLRERSVPEFANCYERVGTGRLFGSEVDALYQSTNMSQVILT